MTEVLENYLEWKTCTRRTGSTVYKNVSIKAPFGQFLQGDKLERFVIDFNGCAAACILQDMPDKSVNETFIRLSKTNRVDNCYRNDIPTLGFIVAVDLPNKPPESTA